MKSIDKARKKALIRKANALLDQAEKCVETILNHARTRNDKKAA